MKNSITQTLCMAMVLGAFFVTGCEGNAGVVEAPVMSAEELAALETRKAEYSKSMQESYGKKNGR